MLSKNWYPEDLCERDRGNIARVNRWMIPWVILFIAAIIILGPQPGGMWETPLWMWTLAVAPLPIGFFAVRAYVAFLLVADELIKKIHMEALALGCAAGLIVGTGFGLIGQLAGESENAGAFIWCAIIFGWAIGFSRAVQRYRV